MMERPTQPGQRSVAANDAAGLLQGEISGAWHLSLSSRAVRFVNAVPRLNRDHAAGMPAANKVQ
jgi:hypothetical protein